MDRPQPEAGTAARSVYLHAPFCARRCFYCDFAVHVSQAPDPEPWLDAIGRELTAVRERGWPPLAGLRSVYVGGGTPSLLGAQVMDGVRALLDRWWPGDGAVEWTAEANPESFTPDVARGWAAAGVNRISLGVQSFDPTALRWMGRLHGPEGAVRAVEAARDAGIDNLSVDLIFALPTHLGRRWDDDLEAAIALDVPHVSLYGLGVEQGTALARWISEGREAVPAQDVYRREYLRAAHTLRAAGYLHYEVSNFSRPGRESVHNRQYWNGSAYLGLGNGAHSFRNPVRQWNVRSWEDYLRRLRRGETVVEGRERLTAGASRLERIWLGLRRCEGLPLDTLPPEALTLASRWADEGRAHPDRDRLRLTAEGWLWLDRLALELDRLGTL